MKYLKISLIWAVICVPVAVLNGYFGVPVWFAVVSGGVAGVASVVLALKHFKGE